MSDDEQPVNITFTHHGTPHTFALVPGATISDLSSRIASELSIPSEHQKFMITPKVGIVKPPFANVDSSSLDQLQHKRIVLLAPTAAELNSVSQPVATQNAFHTRPTVKSATPTPHRDWRKSQDEARYTFHRIIPLPYLPSPERSAAFLLRLKADPGIKAAMIKHKFSVGTLTEMNPVEHTTHESKTLGLNRNRGAVIELRLRTDAYDGYRDYKTIRNTLCHELAHNVHGPHNRNFWELCKAIEAEVARNDWTRGGRSVGNEEFYNPDDREHTNVSASSSGGERVDGGRWTDGEFLLGSGVGATASEPGAVADSEGGSVREARARAAEARMQAERKEKRRS